MEHDHRAGWAERRDDAAMLAAGALDQLRDQCVIERPQRIARRREVVGRVDDAFLVAARNEHQRSVECIHVVEKNRDVHCALGGHQIVVAPGAVVLVPLPDVAFERRLAVDLELVHVDRFAEQLLHRLDHAWMAREPRERLAVQMRGEGRPHCV